MPTRTTPLLPRPVPSHGRRCSSDRWTQPPAALWPMDLAVRLFGLSPWSVLLPQALEGVAAVAVLYACISHVTRASWPGVVAGTLFVATPVTVLIFRYNNPDALLTL